MKICYAIQPAFYETLKPIEDLHALLEEADEKQRDKIQIFIDIQALRKSADAFFQKEIEQKEDCLYYDHFLKSCVYEAHIRKGAVLLDDCMNPFYQLLKRKYRYLIVQEVDK